MKQRKAKSGKRNAWLTVILILFGLWFLSSIPGLRVLPVLRQVNILLQRFDLNITLIVHRVVSNLPEQLEPARSLSGDFYLYARQNPVIIEFLLRKTAHVFVFFIITLVIFLLVSHYLKSPWWSLFIAFICGSFIAVLDEFHQGFVEQRYSSIIDVAFDMVGVSLAVLTIILALIITARWREPDRYTNSSNGDT